MLESRQTSLLGMGRLPDSLGASAKKVHDAIHRFKKCIGYKLAFESRCIVSNLFASIKKNIYLYIITSGCATLLLFRK